MISAPTPTGTSTALAPLLAGASAALNATAALLLIAGRAAIARGLRTVHRRLMLSAFAVSVAFLGTYAARILLAGTERYQGPHRVAYFTLLGSHTVLAAIVPFLAIAALYLGLRASWDSHRRVARIALPIWLYVSVSGVAVYFVLFHAR